MDSMSYRRYRLERVDLPKSDMNALEDMSAMFADCHSLSSLDLSGMDTTNVTNMRSVFYRCYSMPGLNLSGANTSEVTSMDYPVCGVRVIDVPRPYSLRYVEGDGRILHVLGMPRSAKA